MGCSVGFKYANNALVAGALAPLGELMTLPRPLSQLGRGTPHTSPASILVPLWKPGLELATLLATAMNYG